MGDAANDPQYMLQLRVALETRREFLVEQNVLDDGEPAGFDKIHSKMKELEKRERMEMERRTRKNLREVNEIVQGERKTFDGPKVRHEDLVDGVRIPGFYKRNTER